MMPVKAMSRRNNRAYFFIESGSLHDMRPRSHGLRMNVHGSGGCSGNVRLTTLVGDRLYITHSRLHAAITAKIKDKCGAGFQIGVDVKTGMRSPQAMEILRGKCEHTAAD